MFEKTLTRAWDLETVKILWFQIPFFLKMSVLEPLQSQLESMWIMNTYSQAYQKYIADIASHKLPHKSEKGKQRQGSMIWHRQVHTLGNVYGTTKLRIQPDGLSIDNIFCVAKRWSPLKSSVYMSVDVVIEATDGPSMWRAFSLRVTVKAKDHDRKGQEPQRLREQVQWVHKIWPLWADTLPWKYPKIKSLHYFS